MKPVASPTFVRPASARERAVLNAAVTVRPATSEAFQVCVTRGSRSCGRALREANSVTVSSRSPENGSAATGGSMP